MLNGCRGWTRPRAALEGREIYIIVDSLAQLTIVVSQIVTHVHTYNCAGTKGHI